MDSTVLFLFLDSTLFRFDSTFWLDSRHKFYYGWKSRSMIYFIIVLYCWPSGVFNIKLCYVGWSISLSKSPT